MRQRCLKGVQLVLVGMAGGRGFGVAAVAPLAWMLQACMCWHGLSMTVSAAPGTGACLLHDWELLAVL